MDLASLGVLLLTGVLQTTIEPVRQLAAPLFFGAVALVDLRMMGVIFRQRRFTDHYAEILPLTLAAFAWTVVFGALLFISKAQAYAESVNFRMKMRFVAMAAANMVAFHFGIYRRVANWDARPEPPVAVRVAGGQSLAFWITVICFGRWTGWTT